MSEGPSTTVDGDSVVSVESGNRTATTAASTDAVDEALKTRTMDEATGDDFAEAMDVCRSTFSTLRTLIVVVWLIYPVWWIVDTEGLQIVSLYVETAGFMVLDLVAKVGFGIILLSSREVLDAAGTAAPAAERTATHRQ